MYKLNNIICWVFVSAYKLRTYLVLIFFEEMEKGRLRNQHLWRSRSSAMSSGDIVLHAAQQRSIAATTATTTTKTTRTTIIAKAKATAATTKVPCRCGPE